VFSRDARGHPSRLAAKSGEHLRMTFSLLQEKPHGFHCGVLCIRSIACDNRAGRIGLESCHAAM
jgi:hypothetical protein